MVFEQTKLTKTIIQALQDSLRMMDVHQVKTNDPQRLQTLTLLQRLLEEPLDVRFVTRDY